MKERTRDVVGYAAGYALALALTATAFGLVLWRGLQARMAFGVVLALGLAQVIVHLRFFLQVGLKRSSRHDLQLIAFSSVIIALMVSGTLVILFNLRARMM